MKNHTVTTIKPSTKNATYMSNKKTKTITALAGFFLIDPIRDEANKVVDSVLIPIIAWTVRENSYTTPITIFSSKEDNFLILTPDGRVFDELETEYPSIQHWIGFKNAGIE